MCTCKSLLYLRVASKSMKPEYSGGLVNLFHKWLVNLTVKFVFQVKSRINSQEMSVPDGVKSKLTNKKKVLVQNVVDFIYSLSKEMNIIGTQGVIGNELELIVLVRNCKFLYDRNQPDFTNIKKKNAAWNAIATVMNAPVQEVQQRWRCLREAYNKHKKEVEGAGNLGIENMRLWEFYEDMKFIEPYIVPRRSTLSKFAVSCTASDEGAEDNTKEDSCVAYYNESSFDVFKFIAAVEERPILYDNKNFDFKNVDLKKQTWKEISQTFGISIDDCECKWKRLRERYGKERKLIQKGRNEGRIWQYFDALSFLDSFVKIRRPSVYLSVAKPQDPQDIFQDTDSVKPEQNQVQMDGGAVTVSGLDFTDDLNPSVSRCSSSSTTHSEPKVCRSVQMSPVPEARQSNALDEDDLFGQMIAAELKAMPRGKKKMKLKADMYRLLYENESE